jgi:glutamine---fructose-6-phosphate transaminase (isomerizing)
VSAADALGVIDGSRWHKNDLAKPCIHSLGRQRSGQGSRPNWVVQGGPSSAGEEQMPVVTVAPNDALLEKLKSKLQEVRARGGQLYVFADGDTHIESGEGVHVIRMLEHDGALSPLLHVVPLQLLAYHTACARGTDVDKPRNLAKSVTVE